MPKFLVIQTERTVRHLIVEADDIEKAEDVDGDELASYIDDAEVENWEAKLISDDEADREVEHATQLRRDEWRRLERIFDPIESESRDELLTENRE